MKFESIGENTSGAEITDISPFGIWLLVNGKEYFLGFDEFPWFRGASLKDVFQVTLESPDHLRWANLDVDLALESIKDPGAFPMVYEPKSTYGEQDAAQNGE